MLLCQWQDQNEMIQLQESEQVTGSDENQRDRRFTTNISLEHNARREYFE